MSKDEKQELVFDILGALPRVSIERLRAAAIAVGVRSVPLVDDHDAGKPVPVT